MVVSPKTKAATKAEKKRAAAKATGKKLNGSAEHWKKKAEERGRTINDLNEDLHRDKLRISKAPPKGAPKKSVNHNVHSAVSQTPSLAASIQAMKIWDPSFSKATRKLLESVAKITPCPLICRFDIDLPFSDSASTTPSMYETMVVITPNTSPMPGFIWRSQTVSGNRSIAIDPVFFGNFVSDTPYIYPGSNTAYSVDNNLASVTNTGGVMGYEQGSGDNPAEFRTARLAVHIQTATNQLKRFGNIYVRRYATPIFPDAYSPNPTNSGPSTAPFPWNALDASGFDHLKNSMMTSDTRAVRYSAENLVTKHSISCIPCDNSGYQRMYGTGGNGPYSVPSTPVVGNGSWFKCAGTGGWLAGITPVNSQTGTPTPGAYNTFPKCFEELRNPTQSIIVLYFEAIPENAQKYTMSIHADVQARFKPGLLNNMAESVPTMTLAQLNHERDLGEAAGSTMSPTLAD